MKTQPVELGDLIEDAEAGFASGEDLREGIAQIRMNNVTREGELDWSDIRRVPDDPARTSRFLLSPGDIVFNSTNSPELVGKSALFTGFKEPVVFSNHFLRIRVRPTLADPAFVAYWLHLSWLQGRLQHLATRWVNQAAIRKDDLFALRLALPPLSVQRHVARRLGHARQHRRARRCGVELCNEFLPASFLEMFGDPLRNTKGWDIVELEDVATVERGKFTPRPRNDPTYYGGQFPFIQTGDISDSAGYLHKWTQTLNDRGISVSRSFPPGTIVIAIVGATIGMTAILEIEVYCPDSVVGIRVDPRRATTEYIHSLLQIWRPVFLAQAPETARANINLDTLRPLRVPLPPNELQQQFTELTQKQRQLRASQSEALRQADHLFQTLLHQAFSH